MNKLMMTLALGALLSGGVMAQTKQATPAKQPATQNVQRTADRPEQLTEMMTKRLKLTDEQVPKVKEINERYGKELNDVREANRTARANGGAKDGAAMGKAKDINARKNNELKKVLTPQQMEQWEKMQQELNQRMQEKRQSRQAAKKQ